MGREILFWSMLMLFLIFIVSCGRKYETYLGNLNHENQKFPYSDFDKVETYSFNRDTFGNHSKYLKSNSLLEKYYENREWGEGEKELYNTLRRELAKQDTSILSSITMEYALSSSYVNTLSKREFNKLRGILSDQRDTIWEISSCSPIYRDALVFKKKEKIVGWIDLCFDCGIISFYPECGAYVKPDSWGKLRAFFIKLGHPLRNN